MTAVEYRHSGFGHYFLTALAGEIAALDTGQFDGWTRTGVSIRVFPISLESATAVCRFFSAAFAPRSSHFYTALASECNGLKSSDVWDYEGTVFGLALPDFLGECGDGTKPLYRLYNAGASGAPNHRYTTSQSTRNEMVAQGWQPEGIGLGVVGCVPS